MNDRKKDYIAVFLVAFVASAGGNYGSSFFRANKYTGTQGAAVEQLAQSNKKRIEVLESGLPPKWLIDRIDRMEDKLDKLLEKANK